MQWKLVTHKQYPIFSRYWIMQAFNENMQKSLGMGFSNYKSLYNGIYADEEEFETLKSKIATQLQEEPKNIWHLLKKWKASCDELVKFTKTLDQKEYADQDNKQLEIKLEAVVKRLKESASYIFLHHSLGNLFESWLINLLNQKVSNKAKLDHYFQQLSAPVKKTKLTEAKEDLYNIAALITDIGFEAAKEEIKTHASKYRWLGYDTAVGKDLSTKDVKSEIEGILKEKVSAKQENNRDNIIQKLHLTDKEMNLLNLLAETIYMATYRIQCHMIAGSHMRKLLEQIANRLNTDYANLVLFTDDEIKKALDGGQLDLDSAEARKNKFGVLMLDGKISFFYENEVKKIEEKVQPPKMNYLKGRVANQGNYRGPAKIVMSKKDFEKVEFGDILVTKMTNPDFIVPIEKCGAIVTDIGGITSHASVIARELNKPCITGTQYATEIIQDGDLVELDTEKGLVKKIESGR